jgi:hypothetical protein
MPADGRDDIAPRIELVAFGADVRWVSRRRA